MIAMVTLPTLSVLQSFEAAAKHQSFTLAANELHVTQSAVSRKVRELEGHMGVLLFRHAGRGVELTEAGRNLFTRLNGDLDRLRRTMSYASAGGNSTRILSLAVLPTFSSRWLAPRLVRFRTRHPDIQLAIPSRWEPFDLAQEGVDAAIHFGRSDWLGGNADPLCPEDVVAVCSPQLVADYGIHKPEDSERLPLLHLTSRRFAWEAYFTALGIERRQAMAGTLFDQFSVMISAATHDLGAAIVPTYLIESELAQGILIIIGNPPQTDEMYYFVTPSGVHNPVSG